MIDLNTLAGLITVAIVLAGLAGIVACIVLLIRLIPSPVPGVCQCCGEHVLPLYGDSPAYCPLCWAILVDAQAAGRALPVWQANRAALVAGYPPLQVRNAMLVALGQTQ